MCLKEGGPRTGTAPSLQAALMPSVGGSVGGVPWGRAEGRTLGLLPGPWRARGRARSRHAGHCRTRGDLGSPPEGARLPSPITPHVSGRAGFGAVTAGSPRGARALPAVWPPRRTPPARCRPGPGGGCFREYPDRIAIEGGQGRQNDRQGAPGTPTASRRGPELAAQGPEGCGTLRGPGAAARP